MKTITNKLTQTGRPTKTRGQIETGRQTDEETKTGRQTEKHTET